MKRYRWLYFDIKRYKKFRKPKKYKRPLSEKKKKFLLITFFIIVFIFYFIGVLNKSIKPTLLEIAESRAKYLASTAISNAVIKSLEEDLKYTDLVQIHREFSQNNEDESEGSVEQEYSYGQVTALHAKVINMTKISANLTQSINSELKNLEDEKIDIKIPLTSILGGQLFANLGPTVSVRVLPIGSANVNFATEFSEAGINQTRHRIYLKVRVEVKMVVPLLVSHQEPVENYIPIAETVIVGPIPNYYVNTNKEDFMEVIPN